MPVPQKCGKAADGGSVTTTLMNRPLFALLFLCLSHITVLARPNILWITSEDNSPYLGCYGDALAHTPNLDKLAERGIRYRNAFSNAPVCSAARSTLITGMHATSTGIHNHRSSVAYPADFLMYPEHLRAAGYYCTNNSKQDYNFGGKREIWDESSKNAHYRNRRPGQPFFAIFNFTTTHESRVAPKQGKTHFRIRPEEVPLPPYHPDTPEIRRDWANYYDQMTLMDAEVGKVLAELEELGDANDTIIFYYGDHGGALPRGKRNIHDSGTRVPLIVHIPEQWKHWRTVPSGGWIEDPVAFVDLPATVFSLCGLEVPPHYEGVPFLGEKKAAPREHVFLFRGRMDERYDTVRAVRDRDCRYVRNYSPHRPYGQHQTYAFQVQPSMRSWFSEFQAGRCNDIQSAYWKPKPAEEFYESCNDAHEIHDLMAEPSQASRIIQMREALRGEILRLRDTGFIPEGMFSQLAGEKTIFDYANSSAYPLERILDLADRATERSAAQLPKLIPALKDPHPVMRYWAATGCLILQDQASPAKEALLPLLADDHLDVRVVAAEALAHLGETAKVLPVLAEVIRTGNTPEILAAQNSAEYLWRGGLITLDAARDLVRGLKFAEPADRIPRLLLSAD